MSHPGKLISILIADDDADDRQMTQEALHECRLVNDVHFVEDGEQLLKTKRLSPLQRSAIETDLQRYRRALKTPRQA